MFDRSGYASLQFIGLVVAAGLIRVITPEMVRRPGMISLLAVLSLITLVPTKALLILATTTKMVPPSLVDILLPLALAPLLASILVGERPAEVVGRLVVFEYDDRLTVAAVSYTHLTLPTSDLV